jgi:hypothetical protein
MASVSALPSLLILPAPGSFHGRLSPPPPGS